MSSIVNSQHDVDMTGLHLEQARPVDINKDENSFREKQVCMSFDDVCQLHPSRDELCAKTQDGMLVSRSSMFCLVFCVQCHVSSISPIWHLCGLFVLFSQIWRGLCQAQMF